jgi:hypothetical protein
MSLKILIYGEGAADVGTVNLLGEWEEGCIVHLLEKVNPRVTIDFIPPPHKKEVATRTTVSKKGEPKFEGHGKIIQKLILHARLQKMDYDLIAYFGDTDKETGTKNNIIQAKQASQIAYQQVSDAFKYLNVKGIPMIPLRMLESWLLADAQAFFTAFNTKVILPKDPELLWGDKHDPSSNYPKHVLERILNPIRQTSCRQTFCDIAINMNLATLEQKCPISSKPFLDAAKRLIV